MARAGYPSAPQQLSLFDAAGVAPPAAPPGAATPPTRVAGWPGAWHDGLPVAATTTASEDAAEPAQPGLAEAATPHFQHPQAQRSIQLDGHRVGYAFRRARRRSIGFVVGAEGLSVAAPRWVALGEVEQALQRKAGWILRKLHEQHERGRRLQATRMQWCAGASLPFLGQTLVLVLDARSSGVQLAPQPPDGECGDPPRVLHIGLPAAATEAQVRELVQSWLQRQARQVFEARCAHFAPQLGVRMKRLALSSAATRWGSASADGSVRLNWRLVHFALPVIDYVVAHELAHLREMNHSAAFWEAVRSVVPDFEQRRGALRSDLLPSFE